MYYILLITLIVDNNTVVSTHAFWFQFITYLFHHRESVSRCVLIGESTQTRPHSCHCFVWHHLTVSLPIFNGQCFCIYVKDFLCHDFGLSSISYWVRSKSLPATQQTSHVIHPPSVLLSRLWKPQVCKHHTWLLQEHDPLFIFLNVCCYHKKKITQKVKIVFIANGCLFVTAPLFIQPSVAIETGVVSSLHLEAQNIHWCASLLVYVFACVCVCEWVSECTHAHSQL